MVGDIKSWPDGGSVLFNYAIAERRMVSELIFLPERISRCEPGNGLPASKAQVLLLITPVSVALLGAFLSARCVIASMNLCEIMNLQKIGE